MCVWGGGGGKKKRGGGGRGRGGLADVIQPNWCKHTRSDFTTGTC